jgi:hypothetical protein
MQSEVENFAKNFIYLFFFCIIIAFLCILQRYVPVILEIDLFQNT